MTPARRLLPSGHEVYACPHCHDLQGVAVQPYTGAMTGSAVRCGLCGVRGPIEPDIRRATVGWNNIVRQGLLVEALTSPRMMIDCATGEIRPMPSPRPGTGPGSHDQAPTHVRVPTTAERDASGAEAFGDLACPIAGEDQWSDQ